MTPATATKPKPTGANGHGGPRRGAGRPSKNRASNAAKNARVRHLNEKRLGEGNGSAACPRLVSAATELLAEDGYESLTVTAVCRAAGLSPQTFYEHFADKRALLAALHGPDVEEIDRRLRTALEAQSPLAPSLEAALDQALAGLHPSPSTPKARLTRAMIEIAGTRGFEAATVPELAAAADLTRGAFYRSFSDRADCLAHANELCLARIEPELAAAAEKVEDPCKRTRAAMTALAALLARSPREARIVLVEAAALAGKGRRFTDLLEAQLEQSFPDSPETARRIAAGAATSLLRAELSTAGAHGLTELAPDLTFAALGPLAGPELALAQTNGAANEASPRSANGHTKASTTGGSTPAAEITTTKEGSA